MQFRGGSVSPREGRHRRDDHGFVGAPLDFHDSGLTTPGAAELHLIVTGHNLVLQQVLLSTMNATRLHTINLSCPAGGDSPTPRALAASVTPWATAGRLFSCATIYVSRSRR